MKIKAAVIGATGYAGQELLSLLLQHPDLEVKTISSNRYADQPFSDIYGNFNALSDLTCEEENLERLAESNDVIFLALPHGVSSQKLSSLILKNTKVIDLGADFRLKNKETYEAYYHQPHLLPELISDAVYGLPEWFRKEIPQARLVANPGCFPTCSILSLAPLIKEGIIESQNIVIDAKSGVSGAGRSLSQGTHYNECNESVKAYKVAQHQHTPEIEQALGMLTANPVVVTFTPHLIPMNRGILVTAYGQLKKPLQDKDIVEVYHQYYGHEAFIRLMKPRVFPETRWVKGSNYCDIGFQIDPRTNRIVVIGAIDNLVKGAAGQAVQNMNLLFDLPENTGLSHIPIFPG